MAVVFEVEHLVCACHLDNTANDTLCATVRLTQGNLSEFHFLAPLALKVFEADEQETDNVSVALLRTDEESGGNVLLFRDLTGEFLNLDDLMFSRVGQSTAQNIARDTDLHV